MSGSASFQRAKNSWYALRAPSLSSVMAFARVISAHPGLYGGQPVNPADVLPGGSGMTWPWTDERNYKPAHILIEDNDASTREIATSLLAAEGYAEWRRL